MSGWYCLPLSFVSLFNGKHDSVRWDPLNYKPLNLINRLRQCQADIVFRLPLSVSSMPGMILWDEIHWITNLLVSSQGMSMSGCCLLPPSFVNLSVSSIPGMIQRDEIHLITILLDLWLNTLSAAFNSASSALFVLFFSETHDCIFQESYVSLYFSLPLILIWTVFSHTHTDHI